MNKRLGKQTVKMAFPVNIVATASIAGQKEAQGPLGEFFDVVMEDAEWGEETWEKTESKMQKHAVIRALEKGGIDAVDINYIFAGDLLNQCISSSFPLRNANIPHIGLYGACSTMAESLLLAAVSVSGGFADKAVAMTSSHFASSERQYRFPLGYGGQRTPTAQWTVTGSGAALVCSSGAGPYIESCTVGTVVDLGIKDANNMGAAMAPAALSTIEAHFRDLQTGPDAFDLIVTGDLGHVGKEALLALARRKGISLGGKLEDCGEIVFDRNKQDVHAGGSGCGCSAITLCSDLLNKLQSGKLKKILFCGTGALLSPTSVQQGMSIPGVCHAICLCGRN
jgi:stage V sporulation protein AD